MKQLKITQSITDRGDMSVSSYLNDISKIPLLSIEEEVALALRIKDGDLDALGELTSANLRFVVSVAKQYQNNGLSLSDLINEGNIGLMKAARRFDPSKGFKFISYAVWWIRQSIIQAIVEQSKLVRVPQHKNTPLSKVTKAHAAFVQAFEREPTLEELAEACDITPDQLQTIWDQRHQHTSIDAPMGSQEGQLTMLDVLPDDTDAPDVQLLQESVHLEVIGGLKHLSPREVEILSLYYGLGDHQTHSLHELAEKLGLSRERVRQVRDRAILRLRRHINRMSNAPNSRYRL